MTEYKRQTESKHTIKLTSKIKKCHWRHREALIGATVYFSIKTEFVEDNAAIVVTITDKSGNISDSIEGRIEDNKFNGEYKIPENAEYYLVLTVSIPDYDGLEAKSKELLLLKNIIVNIEDEYKNQIENNSSFKDIRFKIITDTDDHRTGKVIDKKICVNNIHYLNEFKLELYGGDPKEGKAVEQPSNTNDSKHQSSGFTPIKKPTIQKLDYSKDANKKSDDSEFSDFINFVLKTYEALKNPVSKINGN